jgi:hypothetical protein
LPRSNAALVKHQGVVIHCDFTRTFKHSFAKINMDAQVLHQPQGSLLVAQICLQLADLFQNRFEVNCELYAHPVLLSGPALVSGLRALGKRLYNNCSIDQSFTA